MLAPKPEDTFPPVSSGTQAQQSALREELSALKLGGLSKRAIAAGVDSDALEMAQDLGDKSAIIELIVQMPKGKFGHRTECHQAGMHERVQIGQQFASEVKWVMLAKQLRNQHILPFFSLEKWMYSGHRFDPQLFY